MDTIWSDFLNSKWYDWRGSGSSEDRLDKPGWMERFLERWQLPYEAGRVLDVQALRALRDQLRDMAERLANSERLNNEDYRLLNLYLEKGPVVRKLEWSERDSGTVVDMKTVPLSSSRSQQLMADIAAAFAETVIRESASPSTRIRICDNPDCRWVFYDDTRSRTKKFCDDSMCGNLMKVRRFRARHKQSK